MIVKGVIELNIPNIISIFRLILIPVFVFAFFSNTKLEGRIIAAVIFVIAGISDIADGYIARKYNMITKLGEALDPFADKLLHITVLLCLLYVNSIEVWIVIAFIFIQVFLIIGGIIMMVKVRNIIPAKWYGKATACLFSFSIFVAIILGNKYNIILNVLFALALYMSLFALIRYCILYYKNKD